MSVVSGACWSCCSELPWQLTAASDPTRASWNQHVLKRVRGGEGMGKNREVQSERFEEGGQGSCKMVKGTESFVHRTVQEQMLE